MQLYLRRVTTTKRQNWMGHFSQMAAGLTHYVDEAKLERIGGSIPHVTIVTGDTDHLVRPAMSRKLKAAMARAELVEWQGTGHAVNLQHSRRFNRLVEQTVLGGAGARSTFIGI